MTEVMMGVVAPERGQEELMKQAGVEWVRAGGGLPFVDRVGGQLRERYVRERESLKALSAKGFRIMGVTPGPGVGRYKPDESGKLVMKWERGLPDWFGELGSDQCMKAYEEVCAWLAQDLRGVVQAWQVGNELDWMQFRGPMTPEQACDYILAGARGLKRSDPSLIVGHNLASIYGEYVPLFIERLFGEAGLLDYYGIDNYFGSWQPGGPEDWVKTISDLYERSRKPVLINEWGYASAGDVRTEEENRSGLSNCQLHKWYYTWGDGHTPAAQAAFIERAFEAFMEQKDKLMGQFYFRWADQPTCWQCGQPDCPVETAWGLVDLQGRPKPSYYAYREGVRRLKQVVTC